MRSRVWDPGFAILALAALLGFGCSSTGGDSSSQGGSPTPGSSLGQTSATDCATNPVQTGCPCNTPGTLVECGAGSCVDGYRKCVQVGELNQWTDCHSVSTGQVCGGTSDNGSSGSSGTPGSSGASGGTPGSSTGASGGTPGSSTGASGGTPGSSGGVVGSSSGGGGGGGCTLTQGYWKNHASAWPVTSLTIGGTSYTEAQLLNILNTPPGGDASLILAHQLIATLLNAAAGAGQGPIASVVAQAQAWMAANSGGKLLPYGVAASSTAGAQAVALSNQLDAYNNGNAGIPHCN